MRPGILNQAPEILTPVEAAKILRIGKSSIYKLIERGEVPSLRVGRKIIIPRYALENYLNLCYNKAATNKSEPVQKGALL